jgi:hypothetical protein
MAYVGYTGVANQANTADGFALHTSAANVIGGIPGDDVGNDGVVDRYGMANGAKSYILMESTGYVLQEDSSKIVLEQS